MSDAATTSDVAASWRAALKEYRAALGKAPLAKSSQYRYHLRVARYVDWLIDTAEAGGIDGDPLRDARARDWAMRDYKQHRHTGKIAPDTINQELAAIDDFYVRRGLGPGNVQREASASNLAPKALSDNEARRFLRAVEQHEGHDTPTTARNRAIALLPYYAGLRIGEVVTLDVDDVSLSARKGSLRVDGKGGKVRHVPVHAALREALQELLSFRTLADDGCPALMVSKHGARLGVKSAYDVIIAIGHAAGLDADPDKPFTPHRLRHTFGTQLRKAGVDIVTVSVLMGHARLEQTRRYSLPTDDDQAAAIDKLTVDQ